MISGGLAGLAAGGAYALLAVCVVIQYQVLRVVNFALAGLAAFATFITTDLVDDGWPMAPAILVGLLVGTILSASLGMVIWRWFAMSSDAYRATVTIAVQIGIVAVAFLVFGDRQRNLVNPAPQGGFTIGDTVVTWTTVTILVLVAVVTLAVVLVLARTRAGIRLRAISERPMTAELHRIPAGRLSLAIWCASGAVATAALMLIAPVWSSEFSTLSFIVVPALTAALIGVFRHYPSAVAGGLALGVIQGMLAQTDAFSDYRSVVPFAALAAILLWRERKAVWDEVR